MAQQKRGRTLRPARLAAPPFRNRSYRTSCVSGSRQTTRSRVAVRRHVWSIALQDLRAVAETNDFGQDRLRFDLRGRVDAGGADPEIAQALGGWKHAALERADRVVVLLDAALQRLADAGEVIDEHPDALVQCLALRGDLRRVLGHLLLLPAERDRLEQREQRARRGDQHLALERVFEQL